MIKIQDEAASQAFWGKLAEAKAKAKAISLKAPEGLYPSGPASKPKPSPAPECSCCKAESREGLPGIAWLDSSEEILSLPAKPSKLAGAWLIQPWGPLGKAPKGQAPEAYKGLGPQGSTLLASYWLTQPAWLTESSKAKAPASYLLPDTGAECWAKLRAITARLRAEAPGKAAKAKALGEAHAQTKRLELAHWLMSGEAREIACEATGQLSKAFYQDGFLIHSRESDLASSRATKDEAALWLKANDPEWQG